MKKMQITKIILAGLFAICGAFVVLLEPVLAAGRAIVMAPMDQRIILSPGETYQSGFIISDPLDAEDDLSYVVEASSFYPTSFDENDNDDYGGADYDSKTSYNQMVDWITIENPTGTVSPGEEKTIAFSISVPENAPAGGQYASLLVRENREKETIEDSTAVTEVMQMAHIVYAEIAGETVEKGEILENNIPAFLLNDHFEATSFVKNSGNVHTDAEYILQVWPMFSDEEVCTNEEKSETSLVLPETERYHTQICELPAAGLYRVKQIVRIFGEESIVEKTIIYCPIWLLFLVLFAIIALVIWIVMRVRARGKDDRKNV